MPVYGSCAGLILLCRDIENSDQPRLGVLDATVRRNAFGRQVDSFETNLSIPEIGPDPIPAVFIRAPVITGVGAGVKVLAEVNGQAVAVRQNNILVRPSALSLRQTRACTATFCPSAASRPLRRSAQV